MIFVFLFFNNYYLIIVKVNSLSLTYSFWWILVCLMVGGAYAWLQYSKTAPWSSNLNYILAGFRAILITLLCFFLLKPYIQSSANYIEKPTIIIAIDNSESIGLNAPPQYLKTLKSKIKEIENSFITNNFEVNLIDLNGRLIDNIDSLQYINSSTDLAKLLVHIKSSYSNFNMANIVLFSDGIFNKGYTPLAVNVDVPIYTIGIGDTATIQDLAIKEVIHNSTVYEGNKLTIEVHMFNSGFSKVSTPLVISHKGRIISSQPVSFLPNRNLLKTTVLIPIKGNGKQAITIQLKPIKDEFTTLNNVKTIYFDVIDAQKKVLILAASPHPDIKAIKYSIKKNEYYDVALAYELPKKLDYDLIIAHQYPSVKTPNQDKERFLNTSIPKWMILGEANDFTFLRTKYDWLINSRFTGKTDLVKPIFNADFNGFQLHGNYAKWLPTIPPLSMPYGLTISKNQLETVLYQQIGNVATKEPLLFFTKNKEEKMGVLLGTNSWKWKLDEFRVNQTTRFFDELVSKTVQYISADANKRRFYVSPQQERYEKGETVLFNTEGYNKLFERVTGNTVHLEIKSEAGKMLKYTYVPLSTNSAYKVNRLNEGAYSYIASTQLDGIKYHSKGQFVVEKLNKEALNPVADFDLLRKMATKSGGAFYTLEESSQFKADIAALSPTSTIHSSEKEEPLINLKWILLFLILLITTEWFLRKFYGGY